MSQFLVVFVVATFVLCAGPVLCHGDRKPEIVKQIRTEVKKIGQTGKLNCTVENKGRLNILIWHKVRPGRDDLIISKERNIIAPNDLFKSGTSGDQTLRKYSVDIGLVVGTEQIMYTLVVRRLQEEDGGDYKCIIITKGDPSKEWPQKIGRIDVQVPPQILKSRSTHDAFAHPGQPFTFKCYATGVPKPKIRWVREDGMLLPNGEQESIGEIYRIAKVKAGDRGVYRCVASNQVKPPAIHKMRLTVPHKPVVKAVRDTVRVQDIMRLDENRPHRANLECVVSGVPQPVVSWARIVPNCNGSIEILKRGNKYKISLSSWRRGSVVKLSTLTIYDVSSNDSTTYFCRARNSLGKSEAKIVLFGARKKLHTTTEKTTRSEGSSESNGHGGTNVIGFHATLILVSVLICFL